MKSYPPITAKELVEILGTTIKHDDDNKLVALLVELSAYTEDSQLNLSFNAPSSSGKSFIPMEIAALFPQEDVIQLGYVSPTAFFHSAGEFDKEKKQYLVDLERKIIIFLDQPHTMLLEHLRPLLSHDKKEIEVQVTDKSQKHGLRTKKIILRGYPSVVFCSAGLRLDEQEATRFLLLSPEINQEKLRAGVVESLRKASDRDAYWDYTELNPPRQQLRGRIEAIKAASVKNIRITDKDRAYIEERFFASRPMLKPRHQRDIKRLVSLIKIFALLNFWHRKNEGSGIVANRNDIEAAFEIWDRIAVAQELNVPPFVYRIYVDVVVAAFIEKNAARYQEFVDITGRLGLSRQEIMTKHYDAYGRTLDATMLRQQILPMLTQAGLIYEEQDPNDKRNKLVFPQLLQQPETDTENSEMGGGVRSAENQKILDDVRQIFGGGELIT